MEASLIPILIASLQKEKGAAGHFLEFREINMAANSTQDKLFSGDEMWFIVKADESISVESDMGVYDKFHKGNPENIYMHENGIQIKNHSTDSIGYVQFLVVRWDYQTTKLN